MTKAKAAKLVAGYFGSWYGGMVRYACDLLGDLDHAEDLVQQAYLRLYKELLAGMKIENPKAWIFCVLRNDVYRQLHARRLTGGPHRVGLDDFDLVETRTSMLPGADDAVREADEIDGLMAVLTTREREVMILRMASLKYREIAKHLNISVSSVNTLLTRAVCKLKGAASTADRGIAPNAIRRDTNTLH